LTYPGQGKLQSLACPTSVIQDGVFLGVYPSQIGQKRSFQALKIFDLKQSGVLQLRIE